MTLETRISDLATAIATQINSTRARIGLPANLATTDKSSMVAAINEIQQAIQSIDLSAIIDDSGVSVSSAFSSQKVSDLIAAAKTEILGGALPETLDTLSEIVAALNENPDIASQLTAAISEKVSFASAQTLTDVQKATARSNIGAQSAALIGDTSKDFTAVLSAGINESL